MKILQVSAYSLGRRGGVQSHVHALAAALVARGHDVRSLSPPAQTAAHWDDAASYEPVGSSLKIQLSGTKFELSRIGRAQMGHLGRDLQEWRPDVIHAHGVWVPMIPWQLFATVPAARVVTFHDTTGPGIAGVVLRHLFSLAGRWIARHTQGMMAVSTTPLAHLGPACRIRPVIVVPPAVDLSSFCALPLRGAQTGSRPNVLYWGRLEPRKNIQLLTHAAGLIWRGGIDWPESLSKPRFIVSGEGPDAQLVASTAAMLGPQAMQFLPPLSQAELLAQLSQTALCVFPARYGESFGIVLAEALASGVPVLAGQNGGYEQLLGEMGARMLVDPKDAFALACRIRDYLAQPWQETPAICRAYARRYDISQHIDQILGVYEQAVHARFSNGDGSGYQR